MSEEEISISTDPQTPQKPETDNDNNIKNSEKKPPAKKIAWSIENEDILVNWCDTAQCYKWLHSKSHGKYSSKHAWYTIPAIILSTVSGTASFAQEKLPLAMQPLAPVAIGSINIFIGILTTVQQYLKISELNEAHRVAAIAWDKYQRNIKIELAKHPNERSDCSSFIKHCRQEYDRLMETAPPLDDDIIKLFIKTFQGTPESDRRKMFDRIRKPDICDEITTVADTRHKWFETEDIIVHNDDDDDNKGNRAILQTIQNFQAELQEKKKSLDDKEKAQKEFEDKQAADIKQKKARRHSMQEQVSNAMQHYKNEKKVIDEYIDNFKKIYQRPPTKEEIEDFFMEENPNQVSQPVLFKYIDEYNDQEHLEDASHNV
jgi:hypothetical protein